MKIIDDQFRTQLINLMFWTHRFLTCSSVRLQLKLFLYQHYYTLGRGSSVGIATKYGLDGPGSYPGGNETFRPSRPAVESTHTIVQRVPSLSPGVKCGLGVLLTTHSLLVPRSWKSRAIRLPTLWATPGLTFIIHVIHSPTSSKYLTVGVEAYCGI